MADPAAPSPESIAAVFDDFRQRFDIRAVAYGGRQRRRPTGQAVEINYGEPVFAFFVPRKLPLAGAGSTLVDGSPSLPKALAIGGQTFATDVIEISDSAPIGTGVMTQTPKFVPGGVVQGDNGSGRGTMACLVRKRSSQRPMALTNHHIAPTPGANGYFYRSETGPWFLKRPVAQSLKNASFGSFLGFGGPAGSLIRVDASLVDLDPQLLPKFTNEVPHIGPLGTAFAPSLSSATTYHQSVIGRQVSSYGWKTKLRRGEITHTFTALTQQGGSTIVACFLVRGVNNLPPSEPGDSGKLWVTKVGNENRPIGLNFGTTFDTMVAVATDFSSLLKLWDLEVLT
jgi:hypothetical protein